MVLILYRKEQSLIATGVITLPVDVPEPPVSGWEQLKAENHTEVATKVPQVMQSVCVHLYMHVCIRKYSSTCVCV